VEYSTDISAISGGSGHTLEASYVPAANKLDSGSGLESSVTNSHYFLAQDFDSNNSQLFIVYATGMGGASTVYSNLTWLESN
jgi:hypothetical protein